MRATLLLIIVIVTVTNSFICYVVRASIKIYLTIWSINMNSIVFSITDFEITEEIIFQKIMKVAKKNCYYYDNYLL